MSEWEKRVEGVGGGGGASMGAKERKEEAGDSFTCDCLLSVSLFLSMQLLTVQSAYRENHTTRRCNATQCMNRG